MVNLLKEHPSAHVSTYGPENPILLEYSEASSANGVRKAKSDASHKIKRLSEPQPEILDVGPSPRRPRAPRVTDKLSCAICYATDANFVMLNPCSHAVFCVTCAANIYSCPLCCVPLTGTQRLFFA